MSADLRKRAEDLVREVKKNGWTVERRTRHWLATGGPTPITIPGTPSDYRAIENSRQQLKRAGYLEENQQQKSKRELRKAKGSLVTAPQELRTDLKQLLINLGEDPNRPEGKKGSKGGARKILIELMPEVYESLGLETPVSSEARLKKIRSVLAGEPMMADHLAAMTALVSQLKDADVSDRASTFQGVGTKNGVQTLVTKWRCRDCHQTFDAQEALAAHQMTVHAERLRTQQEFVKPIDRYGLLPENTNGKQWSDDLHVRVLMAILDPNVTREEAVAIADEVRTRV